MINKFVIGILLVTFMGWSNFGLAANKKINSNNQLNFVKAALQSRFNSKIPLKKVAKKYWADNLIFYDTDETAVNLQNLIKGTQKLRNKMKNIKIIFQDSVVEKNHIALIYYLFAVSKKNKIYLVKEMSLYKLNKNNKIVSVRELEQWMYNDR